MAKFIETNFYSDRQPELSEFFDEFKEAHKDDKRDWYFIRANNSVNPVLFAVPERTELDPVGIPKFGQLGTVVGPLRCGNTTFYAFSPQGKDLIFDDGILIFHDGFFFSEYDVRMQKMLTSQSIPDAEHVSKTPRGIKEPIQRWIPWSYLAPAFAAAMD